MKAICIEAMKGVLIELDKAIEILEPIHDEAFCFSWYFRLKGMRDDISEAIEAAEQSLIKE